MSTRLLTLPLFGIAVVSVSWGSSLYTVSGYGVANFAFGPTTIGYTMSGSSSTTETMSQSYKVQTSTPLFSFGSAGPGVLRAESVAAGPVVGLPPGIDDLYATAGATIEEYIQPSNGQTDGFIRMLFEVHTIPPDTGLILRDEADLVDFAQISFQLDRASFPSDQILASGIYTLTAPGGVATTTKQETPTQPYIDIPIGGGFAFLDVSLFVQAECQFAASLFCAANADWGHTIQFGGATVYDANGILEPGVQVLGESGFNYSLPITSENPEPSTACLLFAGVIGILFLRRQQREFAAFTCRRPIETKPEHAVAMLSASTRPRTSP